MRLAVAGASGFVGTAVVAEAQKRAHNVVSIQTPRILSRPTDDAVETVRGWIIENQNGYDSLVAELAAVDVLVNAAGMAAPESRPNEVLYGANAALPGLLAAAAAKAGVRRLVHISSAAVQGRRDTLDETQAAEPVTPYGDSKARGEELLLNRRVAAPPEIVVYRPTSVQAADRHITRQLIRLASLPVIPVCKRGTIPLPTTLIQNVAAGILTVSEAQAAPRIVLQPWEGMTARSLFASLGDARLLTVPRPVVRACVAFLMASGRYVPAAAAVARRIELLLLGQKQQANALHTLGFVPPAVADTYEMLVQSRSAKP